MAVRKLCGGLAILGLASGAGAALDDVEGLLQTSARQPDAEPTTFADALVGMVSAAMTHMDRNLALLDFGTEQAAVRKPPKGPKGVRFSRDIAHIEKGSSMLMAMSTNQATWADDDPSTFTCTEHDEWGDNHCRFEYGSNLHFKVAAKIGKPVHEGSKIIIDIPKPWAPKGSMAAMFINRIKPMHVECPACSSNGNCSVVYMDNKINLKIPPCPIPAGETTFVDKTFPLPNVPGLTNAEGRMFMNMTATREDGSVLGQLSMKFGLGSLETEDGPAEEQEAADSKSKKKHHHHR